MSADNIVNVHVAIIGSGFGGLGAAIQLKRASQTS